ncbi:MAG TPA: hypothetical protein VHG51_19165 [Longimicrobiaceae bacterium]|nr:hypothetical protein [Longimicrobiaceae bacterium]
MKRSILACALLLAAACDRLPTGGASDAVSVGTHAAVYDRDPAGPAVLVRFTLRNDGPDVLGFGRCGQAVSAEVERRTADGWEQASGTVCPAVLLMVPLELPPGADYESGVPVAEPGRYRLRVTYGAPGRQHARAALSNEFVVR